MGLGMSWSWSFRWRYDKRLLQSVHASGTSSLSYRVSAVILHGSRSATSLCGVKDHGPDSR
jgi:hypothetical protein